jgi:hypothetical protein
MSNEMARTYYKYHGKEFLAVLRREAKDNPSLTASDKEFKPQYGRSSRGGVNLVEILDEALRALIQEIQSMSRTFWIEIRC